MLTFEREKDALRVLLVGEIDHCAAEGLRAQIEQRLTDPSIRELLLDFSQVTFMDSSGIGLVMGRYKLMKTVSGKITVRNLSPTAYRVMKLAGLERLGEIKQKEVC